MYIYILKYVSILIHFRHVYRDGQSGRISQTLFRSYCLYNVLIKYDSFSSDSTRVMLMIHHDERSLSRCKLQ
jgi:hypothetical protein